MSDLDAFATTEFLGRGQLVVQDPERLSLFAQHLAPGERVRAVLPLRNTHLFLTDRRVVEFKPHLEVHGAWNVLQFRGFEPLRQIDLEAITGVDRRLGEPRRLRGQVIRSERLVLATSHREHVFETEPYGLSALTPEAVDRFLALVRKALDASD